MTMRVFAAILSAAAQVSAFTTIPAASPLVLTQGFVQRDAAAGTLTWSWEGVQLSFIVSGATGASIACSSSFTHYALLHVFVDGSLVSNLSLANAAAGERNYTLVSDLNPGAGHNITLWYATDPIALEWPYLPPYAHSCSLLSTDGVFTPPDAMRRTRRLHVIGDSITAGNQINRTTCAPDHAFTYGAQLCEAFHANCSTTAISGKGLYANCCDGNDTMAVLYRRVIPGVPGLLFDPVEYTPDAVLLNLGTNDENKNNGSAWEAGFIATYALFLHNLTVLYSNPSLPIFCGVGPITHSYEPLVLQAMQLAQTQYGVRSTTFVNYTTVLDGCGHPGFVGHDEMYAIAKPIVAAVLGW